MKAAMRRVSPTEIVILFDEEDGNVCAVYCDYDESEEDPLSQFNTLLKALYDSFINPVNREITICKRKLGFAISYIKKHTPIPADKQEKYLGVIAECKRNIDSFNIKLKDEMKKIHSFYSLFSTDKIRYWRTKRDRDLLAGRLEQMDAEIKRFEDKLWLESIKKSFKRRPIDI